MPTFKYGNARDVEFPLMFAINIAELVASAILIVKAIPEDEKSMCDYIDQW
jgi:hypothetical protein